MKIVNVEEKYHSAYFCCLEEWSDEMKEAGNHKACWYNAYKDRGLLVKLAVDQDDNVCGMIQYLPVEQSFVEGRDLYFILCIWVHGEKQGIGDVQGQGIGTQLLEAAEQEVKALGAKGVAAWGLWLPIWMKASWFKKHGYKKADRQGATLLVWKAFSPEAQPPQWIEQKKEVPVHEGKVTVCGFMNGWCPAQNVIFERARRAAAEFGDKVVFERFDTKDRHVFLEWGISDGVFVDGKRVSSGPPIAYDKLLKKIRKRVAKL